MLSVLLQVRTSLPGSPLGASVLTGNRERFTVLVDSATAEFLVATAEEVAESARAHSYISSKQVQKTCQIRLLTLWLLTFWLFTAPSPSIECQKVSSALEIESRSVFCTLVRVIAPLQPLLLQAFTVLGDEAAASYTWTLVDLKSGETV